MAIKTYRACPIVEPDPRLRIHHPRSLAFHVFYLRKSMPSRSRISRKTFLEVGVPKLAAFNYCSSFWSLKNGRPDLSKQNPHAFCDEVLTEHSVSDPDYFYPEVYPGGVPGLVQPFLPPGVSFDDLEQIALAKFTGKLRKGGASLGVTVGSWGQSSEMITRRLGQASRALSNANGRLLKDRRRLRRVRREKDPLANLILEGEFGWKPLVQDIQSAFRVIAGDTIPPVWVTGRHRANFSYEHSSPLVRRRTGRETFERSKGDAMVTLAATCSVSNPNAFLLNHLGLLNPLAVAWDLIPWSFVVGMFVNVNAFINSLTDEIGLDVRDKSTTRSCRTQYDLQLRYIDDNNLDRRVKAMGSKSFTHRYRDRVVGSHPALKLRVQVPELNKEQMVIAGALVLQRFSRISKLIAI